MADGAAELTPERASEVCLDVVERIESAVVVDRDVLVQVLASVIARGHVLLEDVPGTGKSVTARVLAESLGLGFKRLQFTPDLLPADVTGSNVYNEAERTFEFVEGPVFTNVVLADEINRAPPKTQAALLEAMEERQVSVDGTTHDLPEPFFVIATQNPVEQEGTFRLPEAQRDRFSVKTAIGYPDTEGELGLLERRANRRTLSPTVDPVVGPETVERLQQLAETVTVDESVRKYIVDLASATRRDGRTEVGVSPRGVQRVFETARALAVVTGRDYVAPDDVKRLAEPTMAHRVVLTTEATVEGVEPGTVVRDALDAVEVPGVSPTATGDSPGQDSRRGSDTRQDRASGQPGGASGERERGSTGSQRGGHADGGGSPRSGDPGSSRGQPGGPQGHAPESDRSDRNDGRTGRTGPNGRTDSESPDRQGGGNSPDVRQGGDGRRRDGPQSDDHRGTDHHGADRPHPGHREEESGEEDGRREGRGGSDSM